jgi:hypothetical protein
MAASMISKRSRAGVKRAARSISALRDAADMRATPRSVLVSKRSTAPSASARL